MGRHFAPSSRIEAPWGPLCATTVDCVSAREAPAPSGASWARPSPLFRGVVAIGIIALLAIWISSESTACFARFASEETAARAAEQGKALLREVDRMTGGG
jgi:hypothetical protein